MCVKKFYNYKHNIFSFFKFKFKFVIVFLLPDLWIIIHVGTYIRSFITLPQSPVYNFAVFAYHTQSHTSFEHVYCEINFSQGIHKKGPLF